MPRQTLLGTVHVIPLLGICISTDSLVVFITLSQTENLFA